MSDTRSHLVPSSSFSGSPSATAVSKPLKRRLTSTDLAFFTPAASSFKPRPYIPKVATRQTKPLPSSHRSFDAIPTQIMDPSPTDPTLSFIHPPFTTFPDSHLYTEGLTYSLMAANPNWFLDPNDFISRNVKNPNAVPYPSYLEPPRGWCPAKKKDLKDRGTNTWPEGEEPRLRCTFCRRTYAGVNAKSMWRRHVYEKHKIAMSNRRDGSDGPRGRGSNKENKCAEASRDEPSGKVNTGEAAYDPKLLTTIPLNSEHHTVALSVSPQDGSHRTRTEGLKRHDIQIQDQDQDQPQHHIMLSPVICPVTPRLSRDSNTSLSPLEASTPTISPVFEHGVIPESPYNSLLTPSFRHSPHRLPSVQPWRFPSPSHPLHMNDFSLAMLEPTLTPLTKNNSPASGDPLSTTPFEITSFLSQFGEYQVADTDNPETKAALPRPLFSRNHVSVRDAKNDGKIHGQVDASSLNGRSGRSTGSHRKSHLSPWHDPFAETYSSWIDLKTNDGDVGKSILEDESPVLRTGTVPIEVFYAIRDIPQYPSTWPSLTAEEIDEELEIFQASSSRIQNESPLKKKRKISH